MDEMYARTVRLLGDENTEKLKNASVAVFGLGGVGGYCAEALVRAGIGKLLFVDSDCVDTSNLNRQILALRENIGLAKVDVAKARALSINPDADITALKLFFNAETADSVPLSEYEYIADCIDSVPSKLLLVKTAQANSQQLISSMGTAGKLDPLGFEVSDITKTSVCPLARVMRRELKALGIAHLPVVFSKEKSRPAMDGATLPGTLSCVPGAAGLAMAGWIIRSIVGLEPEY